MKSELLVSTLVAVLLLVLLLEPIVFSSQPPIILNTLYVGHGGGYPGYADPARAYDTSSGELIFNVYETLIVFGEPVTNQWKTWDVHEQYWVFSPGLATNVPNRVDTSITVMNTSTVDLADPYGSTWTAGLTCMGFCDINGDGSLSVKDVVYTTDGVSYRSWSAVDFSGTASISMTLNRGSYTFNMRTSPIINFFDETGTVVDTMDTGDAEYSFERGLVQDQTGSPQWMFYEPMLGTMNSDPWASNETSRMNAIDLAHLIDDAVQISGNDLILNLGLNWPDIAWKQILSNTWSSIVSRQFCTGIGCWNGDLFADSDGNGYPDWWTAVRRASRSPLDTEGDYRWVGTGPYHVSVFDSVTHKVIMERNPAYWKGWPANERKAYLDIVELWYIRDWSTRKAAFLSGDIDTCTVDRAYMFELLDPVTKEPPVGVNYKTIKNITPTFSMKAIHFTFTINPTSPYVGTGRFPNGIPTDFFNNSHVRKAFAYSFNATQYISEGWYGEADYRKNPLVYGLYPDYYDDTVPGYSADYAAAKAELQAAWVGGQNVWTSGFRLGMAFHAGDDMERIACEMTRYFFQALSTYDGRVGPPFTIDIFEIGAGALERQELPIFAAGWKADYADADGLMRPYMHSDGYFAYLQNYTAENGYGSVKDTLINQAQQTPDGPAKKALYDQLAQIYYDDCPSYPLAIPHDRRWCQQWVKGWYYNALYPSDYYYHMYKEDSPWADVTGPTVGVPDGMITMRDQSYVVFHYGAKAPSPGAPYDPKWAPGVYGCGGCDIYGDRIINTRDFPWPGLTRDVAVIDLYSAKTVIGKGYDDNITVTAKNHSFMGENFNVTSYANATNISILDFNLTSGTTQAKTFTWNTSSCEYGNYTLESVADTVPEEHNPDDNNYTCPAPVHVGVPGDVSSSSQGVYDKKCDMKDIAYLVILFNTNPSSPNWNPNADVNNDGTVNMKDIAISIINFNKHE